MTHYDVDSGLSQGNVICIMRDRMGFMWFGTRDGLNRFDGYSFEIYRHNSNDPNSISSDYIYNIVEDDDGNLWIGTRGGLNLFQRADGTFRSWRRQAEDPNSLAHNTVFSILFDNRSGRRLIWLGTGGGINLFDPATGKALRYVHRNDDPDSLTNDEISELQMDRQGTLWAATFGGGVNKMVEPGRFKQVPWPGGPDEQQMICMDIDEKGNRWFGSNDGLGLIRAGAEDRIETVTDAEGKSFGTVLDTAMDDQGRIWLCTYDQGLIQYDLENGTTRRWLHDPSNSAGLPINSISSIFLDRRDIAWVGTFGSGFSRMQLTPFAVNHREAPAAQLLLDRKGRLWEGTTGNGLFVYHPEREAGLGTPVPVRLTPEGGESITALHEGPNGEIWAGTTAFGLFRQVSAGTNGGVVYRHNREDPETLTSNWITAVRHDRQGRLWVGTSSGLNTLNSNGGFTRYRHDPDNPMSPGGDNISCLLISVGPSGENLWFGSWEGGLSRMDLAQPGVFKVFKNGDETTGISSNTVLSLCEDDGEGMWVGTAAGLNYLKSEGQSIGRISTADGLSGNTIYSLLKDEQGFVWMSTPRGLSRLDPKTLSIRNYGQNGDLGLKTFNHGAGFRDKAGRFYYGSPNGWLTFHPKDLQEDKPTHPVILTRLLIDNQARLPRARDPESPLKKAVELTTDLKLGWQTRILTLEFATPVQGSACIFRYRLDPFDENWVETDETARRATYTNLDPGNYTFRAGVRSIGGEWSEDTVLAVTITTPPWKQWWAILLYILALAALISWYVRQQRRKLDQEKQVVERLRDIDVLKDAFLANTSHELRTPLHGMIGLAESLLHGAGGSLSPTVSTNLEMIRTSGKRLSHLVDDILDFAKLKNHGMKLKRGPVDLYSLTEVVLALSRPLLRNKSVVLENLLDPSLPSVYADEERLQQILHNLVGNAVKFTNNGSVSVSATRAGVWMEIQVRDTGIGIAPEDLERVFQSFEQAEIGDSRVYGGTGLGLTICKQLVELHGGSIDALSTVGKGTTIRFTLPIWAGEPEEDSSIHQIMEPLLEPAPDPVAPDLPASSAAGAYTILVVDDDAINRQVLLNHLQVLGHCAIEAADGETGLEILETEPIDMVLLDIMMPRVTGYEICREIRRKFAPQELPVIFLSARNRTEDLTAGFEAGGNDYIAKPIARGELVARLDLHLHLREANRRLEERGQALVTLNQEQEVLDRIVRQMNKELSLEGVLKSMLELAVSHICAAEAGAFFLWSEDNQRFEVIASTGHNLVYMKQFSFSREELAVRYMNSEQNHLEGETVRLIDNLPPIGRLEGIRPARAMLSMPLHLKGELVGFLVLDNLSGNTEFGRADIQIMERFREHAISALARASYMERIEEQNVKLVRTQEQLVLQDKMASLGTLTSGIGHEINNPTNFVNGSAQNMLTDLDKFKRFLFSLAGDDAEQEVLDELSGRLQPLYEHVQTIRDGSHRIASIVRDLRIFSRKGNQDAMRVDLVSCLESTLNLVRPNFQGKVIFEEDYPVKPMVAGRQGELNQVFMNMTVNACQALAEKGAGRLIVRTRTEDEMCVVHFIDDGPGISPEDQRRIFEPFFTTKPVGKGTGLGLSISFGIIEQHEGRIELESEPGKGAHFMIYLPMEPDDHHL
ncbi:MAG: ATP-binding protein [Acidobacteriota bacterium]|nr:ATP-binding protein [Acidobacteriota bacterium]